MGKSVVNQSEESKAIKRINERINALSKLQESDNPFISPYSRAIHEIGIDFRKEPGTNRYVIRNTAENRRKVQQLEKRLTELKAKTVGDIRLQAKKELREEAQIIAKKSAEQARAQAKAAGKNKQQIKQAGERARKAAIKKHTNTTNVNKRIQEKLEDIEIQDKLDVIYQYMGETGTQLGAELSRQTRGISRGEQDHAAVYDIIGRINDTYRKIQSGELQQADEQRAEDNAAFKRHYKRGSKK